MNRYFELRAIIFEVKERLKTTIPIVPQGNNILSMELTQIIDELEIVYMQIRKFMENSVVENKNKKRRDI
jgi:hypothetical protein